ncbi:FAR1-related sequence 5-like protein [Tanacetum coccineum]
MESHETFDAKCMRTPRPTLYEQNETPGGSIYWEPHVEGIPIPVEGTYYGTIDEALDMYTKYAEMAGFEVKKGGQRKTKSGAVQHKYIYCNKEGVPKGININTLDPEYNKQKMNTTTHATGCKAHLRLVLDSVSQKYKLDSFKPKHNHMLIPKEYKHFTKKQRKMNQSEKMFVVKAATNKIGATRAHNLYCSIKGRYEYVHGTSDDFKNHQRDVNQFIGESEAQMLINKMENRKNYVSNFTFQYKVDNSELVSMFWSDEVAKCNYKEFRDIESQVIPYESLVIPFESYEISLESHVILVESQEILLESHISLVIPFESYEISHESHVILVESQKILLESHVILLESHVILLFSQICKEIYNETDFKECFDKIVWNMFIEPLTFEEKWAQLIEDFDLKKHKWSESENSFFKSFTSPGATLVSFMMSYESAMERQRENEQETKAETVVRNSKDYKIGVESHEISMESHVILWNLMRLVLNLMRFPWNLIAPKQDGKENSVISSDLTSSHSRGDTSAMVKAHLLNFFDRVSIVDTIRCVSKNNVNINVIPKQYILRRWTRDIIPPNLRRQRNRYGEKITIERLTNEAIFLIVDKFILLSKDEGKMGAYVEKLKILLDEVKADMPNPPSRNTGDVIGGIFSITKPNQIAVQNPTKAVNKGEHLKKGERLKSEREKALKVGKKKLRVCGFCKEKTNEHTKTTCPLNPKAKKGRRHHITVVRHVIHYGSHLIHSESHEIHSESHEIHSESHGIQSESLWTTSDSL